MKGESIRLPVLLRIENEKGYDLQRKLYQKAKQEPEFRFYSLYDKVYRGDILETAYHRCRNNRGKPGVDGVAFEHIETQGLSEWLRKLGDDLREKTYRPDAVRRVNIPKGDGSTRPLGIPTIRDRVVQMAVLIVLEPIFEADFDDCSYGFRPGRSAQDAISAVKNHMNAGFLAVYDADFSKFFDSIPHEVIMETVRRRIVDKEILSLIRQWLKAPIVERGGPRQGKRNHQGTPQGGVISPLLANVVLNELDQSWNEEGGPQRKYNARLVRYADDLVILARYIGQPLRDKLLECVTRLNLKLNEEKTRIVDGKGWSEKFSFLGYGISYNAGRVWLRPSKKAVKKLQEKIRQIVTRGKLNYGLDEVISELNVVLKGWKAYFKQSTRQKEFRDLDFYIAGRFYRLAKKLSQRKSKLFKRGVYATLKIKGLYSLSGGLPVNV
jgi:RNA-directed DNA polymerase